MVLTVLNEKMA